MPERRPEITRPAPWRKPLRAAAMLAGLALIPVAIPAGSTAIKNPGLFADITHALLGKQSPTEQKISDALHVSLGVDASVRCAEIDDTTMGTTTSPLGLNLIRLHNDEVCNKLSGDINTILSGTPFGVDMARKIGIVRAILVTAHEGDHIKYHADSEAVTECQGYQDAPDVAMKLGANDASMEEVLYLLPDAHKGMADEYMTTADCADGGLYDLHPDQYSGVFPAPGRHSS